MRAFSGHEGKAKPSQIGALELRPSIRGVTFLPWARTRPNMDAMPGTSTRGARKRRTARERTDLWKRVGAFVRMRREELGLSQGDIIQVLGYKSRNAVSNIEVGIEGLPAKRAYAWADVLELPRDAGRRVRDAGARHSAGEEDLTAPSSSHGRRSEPCDVPLEPVERSTRRLVHDGASPNGDRGIQATT